MELVKRHDPQDGQDKTKDVDFSKFNLTYMTMARDLAREDAVYASTIFGVSIETMNKLALMTADELSQISDIKVPIASLALNQPGIKRMIEAINSDSTEAFSNAIQHVRLTNASA